MPLSAVFVCVVSHSVQNQIRAIIRNLLCWSVCVCVCGWICCVCALCMCTQEHMSVCGCLDIGICVGGCSSVCGWPSACVHKWSMCVCEIFHPFAEGEGCLSNPRHSCALWSGARWMLRISAETWRQKPGGHLRGFSSDGSLGINPPSLQWENPALGLVFQVQLETVAA